MCGELIGLATPGARSEERQMTSTVRDCPSCGFLHQFAQVHPDPERCPDVATGRCPEWFCTGCGTGLMVELPPVSLEVAARTIGSMGSLDRVA
jgi:hypothetical protein